MTTASNLQRRLAGGQFVVTAEVIPPLSADPDQLLARAMPLRNLVDAVNVTDGAGARVTLSSFAAAAILAKAGIQPVLQITCRDRNRIALAAELIGAAAQGVRNILVLHGDEPKVGDEPEAKPVYDLDSKAVMTMARRMRDQGTLPSGRPIIPPPDLFIGGADTPIDPPRGWHPDGLLAKAAAGADFIQTQFCFDLGVARRYAARLVEAGVTEQLHLLIGVGPIASARSAQWMRDNLHGVTVPDGIIARLEGAADPASEGRRICMELVEGLRETPGISGVHLMAPLQGTDAILGVLNDVNLHRSATTPAA